MQDILDFDQYFSENRDKSIASGLKAINCMTFTSSDPSWFCPKNKGGAVQGEEDKPEHSDTYSFQYKISMLVMLQTYIRQQSKSTKYISLCRGVCRISRDKFPQHRKVQWLSAVPDPSVSKPALKAAVQAEDRVKQLWIKGSQRYRE